MHPHLKIAETVAVALLTLALLIDYDLILTVPGQLPAEPGRRAISAVTVAAVCASSWIVLSAAAADHNLAWVLVTSGVSAAILFGVMVGVLGGAALQGTWLYDTRHLHNGVASPRHGSGRGRHGSQPAGRSSHSESVC